MNAKDLQLEVLKLLVQVAWADRDVADAERAQILDFARGAGIAGDDLENLRDSLARAEDLPAPNLNLLRHHREEARSAAEDLIRADARIAADESILLAHIDRLLA